MRLLCCACKTAVSISDKYAAIIKIEYKCMKSCISYVEPGSNICVLPAFLQIFMHTGGSLSLLPALSSTSIIAADSLQERVEDGWKNKCLHYAFL
ncbi:unnamed protein product [Allacma fusca]|uniref:Uncharacterized protein n=1 Tax=Allacma fusca TaxID=39272 RepID=A0A8J2KSM2_9HEXA|nr:unnamed protein product [Allacma fusca]